MQIPLDEFEQIIDDVILKRGLSYFNNGSVLNFLEISTEEYEAVVSGSEEYTVALKISNNTITEHYCDCPYDYGPVCKHIAAAIFYLMQEELQLNEAKPKKPRKKTTSVSQQIKQLLKTISHKELMAFVEENSKKDRRFRSQFIASFGHLIENQSKGFYQKQIHSILQSAAGRDGWIGMSDMRYVFNTTQVFVENATNFLASNQFKSVFAISTALLEEMTEAFQYGDDSNGDLGYFIDAATELLSELTQMETPETLRNEIFEYCISSFQQNIFKGWDWHLEMLNLASNLIKEEADADIILSCLDTVSSEYEIEYAQVFKLELLRRFKEDEVEKYINQHLSNHLIRKNEIELAFEKEDFKRVIKLSKDGIKINENNKPGLIKVWYNWLLKVAQAQKNTSNIIVYARILLIDNFYPEQDYYQILKDHIETEDWHSFLEEIIEEITPKTAWTYTDLIREIYIKEAWWDRLFLLLKQNTSLSNIEQNEPYLAKDFSPELINLYSESITEYIEENVGRKYYKTACRYLRRMKKLGGNDQVEDLVKFFQKQYPRRKALIEELNNV